MSRQAMLCKPIPIRFSYLTSVSFLIIIYCYKDILCIDTDTLKRSKIQTNDFLIQLQMHYCYNHAVSPWALNKTRNKVNNYDRYRLLTHEKYLSLTSL